MSYYEKLIKRIESSMNKHPRSMVVMDANTFEVLATGQDSKKLARKLKHRKMDSHAAIIFQKPDESAAWILNNSIL